MALGFDAGARYGEGREALGPGDVPLPIDSRANDVRTSVEWAGAKGMLRVGWNGPSYDNHASQLVWDNPRRAIDASNAGSMGRMAAWPGNNMFSFNVGGAYRMPVRTTLNGVVAIGRWNQDAALLPYTVNTAVSFPPTPSRTTAGAKAGTTSVVLNLTSHVWRFVDLSARYRLYDFDNQTPPFVVARTDGNPDGVTADGTANTWSDPSIGKTGSEPIGYTRNDLDLDASFNRIRKTSLRVGYSRYAADTHYRVCEQVAEDTFRLGADVVGTQHLSFRSVYEHSQRRGDGFDLVALERAEEQPGTRQFDVASRDRDRITALANLMLSSTVGLDASVAWTSDTYLNETAPVDRFGLQSSTSTTYAAGVAWEPREGVSAGVSMSVEDFGGLQQSRTASPGPQATDPTRNWSLDEGNKAWSAIATLDLLRGIKSTELRLAHNYTDYRGPYTHQLPANTTLIAPVLLPAVTSTE